MGFKAPRRYANWKRPIEIDPEHELIEGLKLKHAAEFIELVRQTRNSITGALISPRAAHLRTMKAHATRRSKRLEAQRLRSEQLAAKP